MNRQNVYCNLTIIHPWAMNFNGYSKRGVEHADLGEVEHADYLQDFPILLFQLLPRKFAASRILGNCTHEDTEHSACTCSCHA